MEGISTLEELRALVARALRRGGADRLEQAIVHIERAVLARCGGAANAGRRDVLTRFGEVRSGLLVAHVAFVEGTLARLLNAQPQRSTVAKLDLAH